jgi:DNA-binding transcriptional LysR family regulator
MKPDLPPHSPRGLALLQALGEATSWTEAAHRAGLGVRTLRRRVAALEQQLGCPLGLPLNATGVELQEALADLNAHAERAAVAARKASGVFQGVLRVSLSPFVACTWLAPHLAAFACEHPALRLELQLHELDDPLRPDGPEIVIGMRGPLDPSWIAVPLWRHRFRVVAAPAYWKGRRRPRTPQALQTLDWVASRACAQSSPQRRYRLFPIDGPQAAAQDIQVQAQLIVTEARDVAAALEAGLGLAVAAEAVVDSPRYRGRIEVVLPDWELRLASAAQTLYLTARPFDALSPAARALLQRLRELPWQPAGP